MTPLHEVIINKKTTINPIWIMRQAGRYLPEFREIRKKNPNFIELCLNQKLSSEITLQPIKRFDLDAAIIFSDILMLPYGLNQKVEFKKNFGPFLGDINLNQISKLDEIDFVEKLYPVYKAITQTSQSNFRDAISVVLAYISAFSARLLRAMRSSASRAFTKTSCSAAIESDAMRASRLAKDNSELRH